MIRRSLWGRWSKAGSVVGGGAKEKRSLVQSDDAVASGPVPPYRPRRAETDAEGKQRTLSATSCWRQVALNTQPKLPLPSSVSRTASSNSSWELSGGAAPDRLSPLCACMPSMQEFKL